MNIVDAPEVSDAVWLTSMYSGVGLGEIVTAGPTDTETVEVAGVPDVPGPVTPLVTPLSYTASVIEQLDVVTDPVGEYVSDEVALVVNSWHDVAGLDHAYT